MGEELTVLEIVKKYLQEHGFDGLRADGNDCGCLIDDLAPCGDISERCVAGVRIPYDCGDHDYHIASRAYKKWIEEETGAGHGH